MNLSQLKRVYKDLGASRVYVKYLSPNDNSKNQVYLGGSFEVLNMFPISKVTAEPAGSWERERFKAQLRFAWINEDCFVMVAPHAQLILYPKYPEVRLSGFLKGCSNAPSHLMRDRLVGRILFLGVVRDDQVVAHVTRGHSQLAIELESSMVMEETGVFRELHLFRDANTKCQLLAELARIAGKGWIRSKRLSNGVLHGCESSNCGGYTLEAELGVSANGSSNPDFMGWEIKQFAQEHFERHTKHAITLMTPEPTGGVYKLDGAEAFIRRYGYADKRGRPDRLNFGGVHRVGEIHPTTNLRLELIGFNSSAGKIREAGGKIALLDDNDNEAASWAFESLLLHWNKKHNRACYVPSIKRYDSGYYYKFGGSVLMGQGTDFSMFLSQMACGRVYYDPGIKLEGASTASPKIKRRSQFRISSSSLGGLYKLSELVPI